MSHFAGVDVVVDVVVDVDADADIDMRMLVFLKGAETE